MAHHYLDPQNQAAVDGLLAQGFKTIDSVSPKEARKLVDQLQAHAPLPGVKHSSFKVPFEERTVKVTVFRADTATGPLPVIFWLHGGGFYFGDLVTYEPICGRVALQTGAAVAFVEYSLAPEKKFPTQIEECLAAVQYVKHNGHEHDLMTNGFALAGDSAGGSLVPDISLLIPERAPEIKIVYQVLICPFVDAHFEKPTLSGFEFFDGPLLGWPIVKKIDELYLPKLSDVDDILVSPLHMSDEQAKKQPPTLLVINSNDILRSEGEAFGHLLQRNGIECALIRAEGQIHDSYIFEELQTDPTVKAIIKLMSLELKDAVFAKGHEANGRYANGLMKQDPDDAPVAKRKRTHR